MKIKFKCCFIILVYILISGYLSSLSLEKLQSWLILHPEFFENEFFYIDEKTNKEIFNNMPIKKRPPWRYYDSQKKDVLRMPKELIEGLLNELKTAYDKIDACPELDEYRDTIDKRRKETKYKLLFDQNLDWTVFAQSNPLDWDDETQTLTIRLNTDFVDNYLGYKSSSHTGKLIMDSPSGGHVTLSQTLAHELLHLWLNKNGSDSGECTVWSLEKKCLDEMLIYPNNLDVNAKSIPGMIAKTLPPVEATPVVPLISLPPYEGPIALMIIFPMLPLITL